MTKNESRTIPITTWWSETEAGMLEQNRLASGAPDTSKYIRASALVRRDVGVWHQDLQRLDREASKLSGRIMALEMVPAKEQKAVLNAARICFEAITNLVLKLERHLQK
jgi:hypothetical protein